MRLLVVALCLLVACAHVCPDPLKGGIGCNVAYPPTVGNLTAPPCMNGGHWDFRFGYCVCPFGHDGASCEHSYSMGTLAHFDSQTECDCSIQFLVSQDTQQSTGTILRGIGSPYVKNFNPEAARRLCHRHYDCVGYHYYLSNATADITSVTYYSSLDAHLNGVVGHTRVELKRDEFITCGSNVLDPAFYYATYNTYISSQHVIEIGDVDPGIKTANDHAWAEWHYRTVGHLRHFKPNGGCDRHNIYTSISRCVESSCPSTTLGTPSYNRPCSGHGVCGSNGLCTCEFLYDTTHPGCGFPVATCIQPEEEGGGTAVCYGRGVCEWELGAIITDPIDDFVKCRCNEPNLWSGEYCHVSSCGTQSLSCATDDGGAHGRCTQPGADARKRIIRGPPVMGSTWLLTRRVQATSPVWHISTDFATGTEPKYGTYPKYAYEAIDSNIYYANYTWDKMMFMSGDSLKYMVVPRSLIEARASPTITIANLRKIVTSSSGDILAMTEQFYNPYIDTTPATYTIAWHKGTGPIEDPYAIYAEGGTTAHLTSLNVMGGAIVAITSGRVNTISGSADVPVPGSASQPGSCEHLMSVAGGSPSLSNFRCPLDLSQPLKTPLWVVTDPLYNHEYVVVRHVPSGLGRWYQYNDNLAGTAPSSGTYSQTTEFTIEFASWQWVDTIMMVASAKFPSTRTWLMFTPPTREISSSFLSPAANQQAVGYMDSHKVIRWPFKGRYTHGYYSEPEHQMYREVANPDLRLNMQLQRGMNVFIGKGTSTTECSSMINGIDGMVCEYEDMGPFVCACTKENGQLWYPASEQCRYNDEHQLCHSKHFGEWIECSNQGACVNDGIPGSGNGTCNCVTGFTGSKCELEDCVPACDKGTCDNGPPATCQCYKDQNGYTMFTGPTCNTSLCPIATGVTTEITPTIFDCVCNATHRGPYCNNIVCPKSNGGLECGGPSYGVCQDPTGVCACVNGPIVYENGTCVDQCIHGNSFQTGPTTWLCQCSGSGYVGERCEIPICSIHGTYNALTAKCDCELGWAGAICDECASNFYLPNCDACPNCNSGTCNTNPLDNVTDGTCVCNEGVTGTFCDTSGCGSECLVHGTCITTAPSTFECVCGTGYIGSNCEQICGSVLCSGQGTCANGSSGCTCDIGFQGLVCGEPAVCSPPCDALHGTCNAIANECICESGYVATTCNMPCGDVHCSGFGNCSTPTSGCTCDMRHGGADCSETLCNGHGYKVTPVSSCTCDSGYVGAQCESICGDVYCNGAGSCTTPTSGCTCNATYLPPTCGVKCGDVYCNGNGECLIAPPTGECICNITYKGPTCNELNITIAEVPEETSDEVLDTGAIAGIVSAGVVVVGGVITISVLAAKGVFAGAKGFTAIKATSAGKAGASAMDA